MDSGSRLGHYEILEPLGVGGMGEVYRARDTVLGRDVAIKVLPADFAADAERLARFAREATLLAQLNHPNIATIYGLENDGGVRFIAMECVEGETLACGTGSAASAVMGVVTGKVRAPVKVKTQGGEVLTIGMDRDGPSVRAVTLQGKVSTVYQGILEGR